MSFLLKIFWSVMGNALALYVLVNYIDGVSYTGGVKFFVFSGIVLGFLNFFVKPFLKLLAFPLMAFSGGLFLIIINVGILWFLGYFLDVAQFQGLSIEFSNLSVYLFAAIVLGLINWALNLIE